MRPILYSFRRCPYAIRARLALHVSQTAYELREIHLRDKPAAMLAASPKGSVPVLVLPDNQVIDESWEIMQWALEQNDPDDWLGHNHTHLDEAKALVTVNDSTFKVALDRYKYADHHPEHPQAHYRTEGEAFLKHLEACLQAHTCLMSDRLSIADMAVFPFVRQFAAVDADWFDHTPYPKLRGWLKALMESSLFTAVMHKHPVWTHGDPPRIIQG